MMTDKELLVEAIAALLVAEEENAGNEDRKIKYQLIGNVKRSEENLDFALHRLSSKWFNELDGVTSKLYVFAVVYRSLSKSLYAPENRDRYSDDMRRLYFNRRNEMKSRLKKSLELYQDVEAIASGKTVMYHLMLRAYGHTKTVLSSSDRTYITIEYNHAFRHQAPGEMHFIAKEYIDK